MKTLPPKSVSVTISYDHLLGAELRRMKTESYNASRDCVMALALKDVFPDYNLRLGTKEFFASGKRLFHSAPNAKMKKVTALFDGKKFDQLRSMLPMTINFEVFETQCYLSKASYEY